MAYCVNCGKELSTQATMCPHCGHPGPAAKGTAALAAGGQLAGWGARVGAALLDGLILLIPFALLAAIIFSTADVDWRALGDRVETDTLTSNDVEALAVIGLTMLSFFIVTMLYKPLMEGRNGQTLGKMWVKIRVVRADDGTRIGYGKAFLRWFISTIFSAISLLNLLNYLWPLWDDSKQTLHDKVASTIVVRA
jgi:uncharacterized RDD family membrane protein YckC